MRVPQSPHSLRKVVTTSSDSDDSSSESSSNMKPPRPFSKKELRPHSSDNNSTPITRTSRDRTRMSAVQRLVERKMAQKEKDREKERDLMFKRSSSVGSTASRMVSDNDKLLRRSLSRERLSTDSSKTYITISSGGQSTRIRESSPTKCTTSNKEVLNKYCSPLKSTEIFKDLVDKNCDNKNEDIKVDEDKVPELKPDRKISFTTEKTILIGGGQGSVADTIAQNAKIRKVSIDINYVYEQHFLNNPGEIQDETLKEASKRRSSLEQKFKERSSSASSSMSTSSSEGSSTSSDRSSDSSLSTPEPVPRQSKQRKMSSGFSRNINIIMEDEISNDNCENTKRMSALPPGLNLPKPKTSFHRRFSQDHTAMNVNIKRSSSPVRKISLQNNSTINTDR